MATMNIPIFIPHFGCPNGCVFCNQQKIRGKDTIDDEITLRVYLEDSIRTAGQREDIEIAFFGGSFTGLPLETQERYLSIGKEYVEKYALKGIRLSTRPDYINENVIKFLEQYPVSAIELGVQSLDPTVLELSKRNHTVPAVANAVACIKKTSIQLGLQMMIGLPGDTAEKAVETAKKMIAFMPDTIRIYPTLVLQDTELERMYNEGLYRPLSLSEAVTWTSSVLPLFEAAAIVVLRVGLQANEGLSGENVIAGPYHPAFKELVQDEVIYNRLEKALDAVDLNHLVGEVGLQDLCINIHIERTDAYDRVTLHGEPHMIQRLYGHKRNNFERIKLLLSTKLHKTVRLTLNY